MLTFQHIASPTINHKEYKAKILVYNGRKQIANQHSCEYYPNCTAALVRAAEMEKEYLDELGEIPKEEIQPAAIAQELSF
jgi:hypothetical protein